MIPLAAKPAPMSGSTDGLPFPRRFWAVLTLALGLAMAVLTGSLANLALPTIAREFQVTASEAIWVANAYQLSVTMTLLPLASLGEKLGYRRVYLWGLDSSPSPPAPAPWPTPCPNWSPPESSRVLAPPA